MAMSDSQKAAAINNAINGNANFLIGGLKAPDTVFQKLAHNLGIDSAPQLVTDDVLDSMPGTDMYRAFSASTQDEADGITMNVMMDNETFYSATGGSVYGRGVYFMSDGYGGADDALNRDVRTYGNRTGTKANIVRAKYNSNLNATSESAMENAVRAEIMKGTEFGKALRKINSEDAVSIMAISKGYNAMRTRVGVESVLDRSCLTMSYTYKKIQQADINKAQRTKLKWKDMS